MGIREHRGIIEAVLFASGEPISAARIAEVAGIDTKTANNLILQLADDYENRQSGIRILKLGDAFQMSTDPQFAPQVRQALDIRRNQPLSQASLEVLAIVAYNQPVTRAFIEQIRGVDCSGVVSTLQEKELIEEDGRLDLPGRPIAFKTTANFLRAFGLSGLDMLPALPNEASVSELAAPLEAALIKSDEDEAEAVEETAQTEEN
ncbi:MAG: SMC-Scp complex subunit ScpB [Clostridia bacterium]|nr:SMC-Scp complex subunit ScpB [Clostridia bacterium]